MDGFCPQCLEAGKVGQACATAKCQDSGYACIPEEERAYLPTEGKPDRRVGAFYGRYLVVRRLGKGAMGSVYLALHQALRRHVALKVPNFLEDDSIGLFENEARKLAAFQHIRIVRVLDHDVVTRGPERIPFLVMEYVADGQTLEDLLRRGGLDREQHLAVLRQVADGLETMHRKGVVHRDIKPGNLLTSFGEEGQIEVVIADLGLAKDLRQNSLTSAARGTTVYMAPEQLKAEEDHQFRVGPAADWYALGCIAWWMLTGSRIFADMGERGIEVLKWRGFSAREALIEQGQPPAVVDFLARCLANDPKQRIRSKAEFLPAMEAAFASLEEGTRPDVFGPPPSSGGEGVLPPGPNSKAGTKPVNREERLRPDTAELEPPIDLISPETNGRAWPRWMLGLVPVAVLGLVSVLARHQTNQVSLSDRFAHLVGFATLKPDAETWRPMVDAGVADAGAPPVADAVVPEPPDQGVPTAPDAAAPSSAVPPTEAPRPLDLGPLNRALGKGDCKGAAAELNKVRPRLKAAQRDGFDGDIQKCWATTVAKLDEFLANRDCQAFEDHYRHLNAQGAPALRSLNECRLVRSRAKCAADECESVYYQEDKRILEDRGEKVCRCTSQP